MSLLQPAWQVPPGVGSAMSQRAGGRSSGPYASMNLGVAVGDDRAAVAGNRARFAAALGARPVWLRQVHGNTVLRLHGADHPDFTEHPEQPADAAWTSARGIACTVQVADCLPVLFALRDGSAVAAAHAGWRGLAAGVLQATVDAVCRGCGAAPGDLLAWLGPCIGPRRFEVGADVLMAFADSPESPDPRFFTVRPRPDGQRRWLANLPALAHDRLAAAGVRNVSRADACTFDDASAFFSFRRDGVTGRMAAAVWRLE